MVSLSAPEMIPFSARNRLGAPFAADLGHFPARQAGGIPFCAGNDTFFCPEPPRSTFRAGFGAFSCPAGGWYSILRQKKIPFSSQNLVAEPLRGGMQPAAQIYGGGHGRGCQKKKFVQKFFSFWNQQFLKKEMGVNLRCCKAGSRTAGEGLLFMAGAFGEPPFLYAVALFKDFQDAPEGGECCYSQNG